ncbi:Adenosylcobinamide-phosphate synthase [Clostridiaceae bacterium JG1575]|nr:Adenosylcobinamide-phosphate synthase [Clostridiaceae bacterium JG1575]
MLTVTLIPMAMALFLDFILGDPAFIPHPVVGFGALIRRLDDALRRPEDSKGTALAKGALLVLVLLLAAAVPSAIVLHFLKGPARFIAYVVLFWFCLSCRTMEKEANGVLSALTSDGLLAGRRQVGRIVGRDTASLDEAGILRATLESVAESTSDGIIAPMFWGLLLGPVGALVYKAINTMDSMIGYRSEKYVYFGKVAARLDDIANLVPARLTALLALLLAPYVEGRIKEAARVYRVNGTAHESPNAGHPEAAFAGALAVRLGGPAVYQGRWEEKPFINPQGHAPTAQDVSKSLRLMKMIPKILLGMLFILALLLRWPLWTGR